MNYFSGCKNIVTSNIMLFEFIIFFFFLLLGGSTAAENENINGLYESWSREEVVQMAGYGEEKLSTVLVTGTIVCDACLNGQPRLRSLPISGALVGLSCNTGNQKSKLGIWAQATTDEYGDFMIDLPSHLHGIPNLHKTCCLKVLRLPKNMLCRPSYARRHGGLALSSVGNGIRTYTAGEIRFKHFSSKYSAACLRQANGRENKQTA